MVLTKWTQEMTTKFISLYREQECLWRIDSLTYRDKDARDTALRNIIDGMDLEDLTIDDVKKKIKYLRSTYMTEINKIEKNLRSGDGKSKIYKPCLTWFDQMDAFIKNVHVKRNTQSSAITQPNTKNPDSTETESDEQTVSDTNNETASGSVETEQQIDTNRKQREKNSKTSKRRADVQADTINEIPKKTDSDQPSQTISKRSRLTELRRSMQEISAKLTRAEDINEFEIYGKYVGVQLKSMNEEDAILAQQEIQTILTRFKLKKVHRNRHISETPSTPHSHVSDYQYLDADADSNNQSRRSSHDDNDHNYSVSQYSDKLRVNETAAVSTAGLQYSGVQCNVEIIEDETAMTEENLDVIKMAYRNA